MPDDHSELVPPLPIPNRTVKRLHANDSADSRVKVGNRQAPHLLPATSAAKQNPTQHGGVFAFPILSLALVSVERQREDTMDCGIAPSTMPEYRYRSQTCRTRPVLQDNADRGLGRLSLADLQDLQHIRCEMTVPRARRGVDGCVGDLEDRPANAF